jgi:hypothetical protein
VKQLTVTQIKKVSIHILYENNYSDSGESILVATFSIFQAAPALIKMEIRYTLNHLILSLSDTKFTTKPRMTKVQNI